MPSARSHRSSWDGVWDNKSNSGNWCYSACKGRESRPGACSWIWKILHNVPYGHRVTYACVAWALLPRSWTGDTESISVHTQLRISPHWTISSSQLLNSIRMWVIAFHISFLLKKCCSNFFSFFERWYISGTHWFETLCWHSGIVCESGCL